MGRTTRHCFYATGKCMIVSPRCVLGRLKKIHLNVCQSQKSLHPSHRPLAARSQLCERCVLFQSFRLCIGGAALLAGRHRRTLIGEHVGSTGVLLLVAGSASDVGGGHRWHSVAPALPKLLLQTALVCPNQFIFILLRCSDHQILSHIASETIVLCYYIFIVLFFVCAVIFPFFHLYCHDYTIYSLHCNSNLKVQIKEKTPNESVSLLFCALGHRCFLNGGSNDCLLLSLHIFHKLPHTQKRVIAYGKEQWTCLQYITRPGVKHKRVINLREPSTLPVVAASGNRMPLPPSLPHGGHELQSH